jgi:hypothetical protein
MTRKKRHGVTAAKVDPHARIMERDFLILEALHYHGVVRAPHLREVVGMPKDAYYRRMEVLRGKYFLGTPHWYSDNRSLSHFISPKGELLLKDHDQYTEAFKVFHSYQQGDDREAKHKIAIADVVTDFRINLPKHGFEFIRRDQLVDMTRAEPFAIPFTDAEGKAALLKPDDIFGIKLPNGKKYCVLLEVETGNKQIMPAKNIKKRTTARTIQNYQKMFDQKAFTHLGVESAFVCFVGPNDRWIQSVFALTKSHPVTITRPFLFKTINFIQKLEEVINNPLPEPKPDGSFLTPWRRCGYEDFDFLK